MGRISVMSYGIRISIVKLETPWVRTEEKIIETDLYYNRTLDEVVELRKRMQAVIPKAR